MEKDKINEVDTACGGGFLEELPIEVFPGKISQFIADIAYTYQCPRDFVTSAVLVAASSVIGNKVHVYDGKYDNPLMLWMVNVAKSGTNKTAPVRKVLAPLFDINREMIDQYKMEKAKAGPDDPIPVCHQLIISDSTEEARLKVIHNNPKGILCYYPEIKGFFDDMSRYSASDGSAKLLRIYDGDDISVNRKSDDNPWDIRNPFMNIIGDIQPALLSKAFGDPKFLANGLNQRFLFNYEDSPSYGLYSEDLPNEELQKHWEAYIREFSRFSNPTNRPLVPDKEAKEVYIEYYNDLQVKKYAAKCDYERSVYSKCQIQILRIAGILHLFNVASNLCYAGGGYEAYGVDLDVIFTIPGETMADAAALMLCFERNAMRVYSVIKARQAPLMELSKSDAIKLIHSHYPIRNVSKFADSIGANRTTVSRIINGIA